jgi:cyanophycinase
VTIVLIGGGWTDPVPVYDPFLRAAGPRPSVACVVLDEGDGAEQAERWLDVLRRVGPCDPSPVLVPVGGTLSVEDVADADALLVCGGLTPAYAAALAPCAGWVRDRVARGWPYAGFSAGAAVASGEAVVGGYRIGGRPVCPEDAGEDLEEVTVTPGLGLVDVAVDVHSAQWGTLGRTVAAVAGGLVEEAVGIDEDTALVVDEHGARVVGRGAVHHVGPGSEGPVVRSAGAGERLPGVLHPTR